jgi:uncharacterized membrane protein
MSTLVTRFHLLLLWVTLALTGVGFLRVPPGLLYAAHWSGVGADWLWPREVALLPAPLVQVILLGLFFTLNRLMPREVLLRSQHVLDPALTLMMTTVASLQLGLLLIGIGSDIDWVRLTAAGLGVVFLVLGLAFFGAERNVYAGIRLPWPVRAASWTAVHHAAGLSFAGAGALLLVSAWYDPGLGLMILAIALAFAVPLLCSAAATLLAR